MHPDKIGAIVRPDNDLLLALSEIVQLGKSNAELLAALRKIANPDDLARDASNFGAFPEAYLRYAQDIARAAVANAEGRS